MLLKESVATDDAINAGEDRFYVLLEMLTFGIKLVSCEETEDSSAKSVQIDCKIQLSHS